jgi:hypothetical protein
MLQSKIKTQASSHTHLTCQQLPPLQWLKSTYCSEKKYSLIHFPQNLQYKRHIYTPQLPFNVNQFIVKVRPHLHTNHS